MSNYVKSTNFTAKDSLPTGDANKVIRGSEFDTEFNAIQVASATKADLGSPTFTGNATFDDITVTGNADLTSASVSININGGTIDDTVIGGTTPAAGTFTSLVSATADINGGTIDGTVIGGSTPAAGTFTALVGTTGTFSGAVSGATGTFSGAVTGSNLNIANWDTAYGWGNHATAGYLTSVAFSDIDAGAVTLSSETFADVDNQIPTNAAVIDYVAATIPSIAEVNDLSEVVTWTTVPDEYISASSVNQHVTLEKATQTKTYTNGETSSITLSQAITSGAPVVSVTKEVPQTGITDNTWDVASDGANYDFENSAYSTTLTPSEDSADGVFTLGTGSFAADDVGKIVSGNGGTAVIINVDGSYNLLTNFTDTSAIASGSWTLKELVVDGDATGIALSSGTDEEGGAVYDFRNTVYTGSNFSVGSQDATLAGVVFNNDGTKMYILGTTNKSVYQYTLSTAFDVSTASYDSVSFSVASQDTSAFAITFNTDGSKMYMVGLANDTVYQYTLSTAFDLSTASYDSVSFSVASQSSSPRGLTFNTDGTKMYVLGFINKTVYQYTLSTAFDVSTASYDSVSFSVASQEGQPYDLAFNADGSKMYIVGTTNKTVYQYTLSTAFDVSSASYYSVNFSVANQDTSPRGLTFNADGSKMYIVGYINKTVFEYSLDPRFNLKSADYMGNSFSVGSQDTTPFGLTFNNDGTKMYMSGGANDSVYQYTLSTAFAVSTASYDSVSFNVGSQATTPRSVAFNNDGTKMYIVSGDTKTVYQYTLSTAFDLSTASYDSVSFNISSQDTNTQGITFNNDGTKMYIVGTTNKSVFQYTLSTAFDLSTASYDSVSFSVNNQDGVPFDLAFNADGSKMYIVGNTNDSVYQYTLSTAFDVSTASYDSVSFSVGSQEGYPIDLAFNADGSKMYVVGLNNKTVYEYEMGGAFSLKTVEYSGDSFSVASQDTTARALAFNADGTKMYILGYSSKTVLQYTLSTAFDVSTASYDSVNFYVGSQDSAPWKLAFNNDGTKMYILGYGTKAVYQYTLSTAFDLSTVSYDNVSFSIGSQDGQPYDLTFNADGSKMYIVGSVNSTVYQYTLSTAFDLSTASYNSVSFSVGSQEGNLRSGAFNADGSKMYIVGYTNKTVYQYTLSTAFDLSTASYDSVNFYVGSQEANPYDLAFNNDGTKMYIVGTTKDTVFQYDIGSTLVQVPVVYSSDYAVAVTNSGGQINTTYWTDVNSTTATEVVGTGEVYYAYSTDNHVTWKVIHNTNGERSIARNNSGTWQYNSNTTYGSETWANATTNTEFAALRQAMAPILQGFQISASTQIHGLDISSYELEPQGLFVKDDGTEIYTSSAAGLGVDQFTLSTAFDLTTASHTAFQSTSSQGNNPRGVFFKPDGTKMYEVQGSTQDVKQYSLSTAWDITTLSFDNVNFVTSGQVTNLREVILKSDGTKMYVVGSASTIVAEYDLSTPWDISTASYNSVSYDFSSQDSTGAETLSIGNDGKTMLIGRAELDKYTLSTAWDITTATFVETFDAGSGSFKGVMFGDEGEKLYYTHSSGTQADTIQEYTATALVPHTANLMDGAQMDAVADTNHLTLANSLDFMIALKNADSTSTSPTSDGVALNYDGNVLNQGAVLGTDYNWDFPTSTSVRLTSLGDYNLKVRII